MAARGWDEWRKALDHERRERTRKDSETITALLNRIKLALRLRDGVVFHLQLLLPLQFDPGRIRSCPRKNVTKRRCATGAGAVLSRTRHPVAVAGCGIMAATCMPIEENPDQGGADDPETACIYRHVH